MTMKSYFWGGVDVGDAGPYDDDEFSEIFRILFDPTVSGDGVVMPYRGDYDSLLVTEDTPSRVKVNPGAALVDGKLFTSDSDEFFDLELPGAGQYFYTVAVEKDFAAQTVRLVLLGPEVVGGNLGVRNTGTLWQNPLSHIIVESTGIVFFYDYREPVRVNAFGADHHTIVVPYSQGIPDSDYTIITFEKEIHDLFEIFTPDSGQGIFPVPVNRGLFEIEAVIHFASNGVGTRAIKIWTDELELAFDYKDPTDGTMVQVMHAKAFAWLERDYAINIYVSAWQTSGDALYVLDQGFLSIKRIY